MTTSLSLVIDPRTAVKVVKEKNRWEVSSSHLTIVDAVIKTASDVGFGTGPTIRWLIEDADFPKDEFYSRITSSDENYPIEHFAVKPLFDLFNANRELVNHVNYQETCHLAAERDFPPLIELLSKIDPKKFHAVAEQVIAKYLDLGRPLFSLRNIVTSAQPLKPFYELWIQVAQRQDVSDLFEKMKLNEEEKKAIYKSAFDYANPYISEPAKTAVKVNEYCLNFMWISKRKEQEETIPLEHLKEWAKKYPDATINFWVDKELISKDALQKIQGFFSVRDVREIRLVQEQPQAFDEKLPVYFRVDLLRAIIADHVLTTQERRYFVYADLDMKPASRLFDKKTMQLLKRFGFVMARMETGGYENGFQILDGAHQLFLKCHKQQLIDANIIKTRISPTTIKEQEVFSYYLTLMTVLKKQLMDASLDCFMPTKPVLLPPSHFSLNVEYEC